MREVGIELTGKPKTLTSEDLFQYFKAINMGCMDRESCPVLFANNVEDWDIPDPKGKSLNEVRVIRGQIESRVKELVAHLKK